jgi:16S rRNA processing protein RimM
VPQLSQFPNEKRRADPVNAGRIAGVFGVRGELKLDASRVGDDAMRAGLVATLTLADGTARVLTVSDVRRHQDRPLIRFAGIDDATAAERLAGARITISRTDAPLGDGEYFDDDLIGCRLIDERNVERGVVSAVLHYPIQDMLVIGTSKTLLPMVGAFIASVDVARKEIRVTVPPGLLDPEAAAEA